MVASVRVQTHACMNGMKLYFITTPCWLYSNFSCAMESCPSTFLVFVLVPLLCLLPPFNSFHCWIKGVCFDE